MSIDFKKINVSNIYSFNNPVYLNNPREAYGDNYKYYLENGLNISKKLLLDSFEFLNKIEKPNILYFTIGAGCKETKYNPIIQQFPSFLEKMIEIPNFTIGIIIMDTNCKLEILNYINYKYKSKIETIKYEYNIKEEYSEFKIDHIDDNYLHYTIIFKNKCSIKIALVPDWLYKEQQFEILDYNINLRNLENLSSLITNFGVHYNNSNKSLFYSTFAHEKFDFRKIITFESIKNSNVIILEWALNYTTSGKYHVKYLDKKKRHNIISEKNFLSEYLVFKKNIDLVSPILTENEILIPLSNSDSLLNLILNNIHIYDLKLDLLGKDLKTYIKDVLPIENIIWTSTKIEII
jgi:hypothetical protein